MPSREELLHSIKPGMKLDKNFFLKIYGYEITWPGFAERALQRLEIMGCSKARAYYACIVQENKYEWRKELKEAAVWYSETLRKKWDYEEKRGEERRAENRRKELLARKKQLLLMKKLQL